MAGPTIRRQMIEILDDGGPAAGPLLPLSGPAPCDECWLSHGWIVARGQWPAGVDSWAGLGPRRRCPHGGTS